MKSNILNSILAGTMILSLQTAVWADEIDDNQENLLVSPEISTEVEEYCADCIAPDFFDGEVEVLEELEELEELEVVEVTEEVTKQVLPQEAVAKYTGSMITVNNEVIPFGAYSIGHSTYVNITDLAYTMARTASSFHVAWSNSAGGFVFETGRNYGNADYLYRFIEKQNETAYLSTVNMVLDGELVDIAAYTINGATFLKLSDMAELLDFSMAWDMENSAINVYTTVLG